MSDEYAYLSLHACNAYPSLCVYYRGLSNTRLIYKAYSERLGDRGIKITSQERLAPPPLGLNHSFASSRDSMKLFGSWVSSFRAKHLAGSSPTDSGSDSRHSKISAVRNPSSIRNSPTGDSAAAFAVASDDISLKDATSDLSGLSPCKSSSRLSAGQMPRARSQEFGPGYRAGSNSGVTSQGSAGSFAELPDVLSAHGRRSRSWVGPVRRYSSLGSSQHTHVSQFIDIGHAMCAVCLGHVVLLLQHNQLLILNEN